jgi:hypothetical protein
MRVISLSLLPLTPLLISVLSLQSAAAVILVDHAGGGDYLTIQEGVDAASDGDTVLVASGAYDAPGDYNEGSFGGKNITILSESGPDSTTMRGLFDVRPGRDTTAVLSGFTIAPKASGASGIACEGSSPMFIDCLLSGVSQIYDGGAIVCWGGGEPRFVSVRAESCGTGSEGGGLLSMSTSVVLRDCSFSGCTSLGERGCGISCRGGSPVIEDVVIERCGSISAFPKHGIAIALTGCDAVVKRVVISNNPREDCQDGYDAIYIDGGTAVLEDVVVAGNSTYGGSIVISGALCTMNRLTVVDESSISAYGDSATTLENSILAFGRGSDWPVKGEAMTVSHSCVYGWVPGDSLECPHYENIFVDPLFCSYLGGDLTLHDDSPCLPDGNPWNVQMGAYGAGGCGTGMEEVEAGLSFRVLAPMPTPSAGPVRLCYSTPYPEEPVSLSIYDVRGAHLRTLRHIPGSAGRHTIVWDGLAESGERVPSGVYFVEGTVGGESHRATVVVLR